MGIESDQLVFDYLSRVGDLAQQRQLPSATRMRLVSELRNEIDRRRAKAPVDSPAAVRRILSRLGTPDDIVAAAREGAPEAGTDTWAAVPTQRAGEADERPKGLRRVVPRPRPAEPKPAPRPTEADGAPSPPHLASTHELGDSSEDPDWWRKDTSPFGLGDSVPGFVGGVEIPELLKPPPKHEDKDDDEDATEDEGDPAKSSKFSRFPKPSKSSKPAKPSKAPKADKPAPVEEADVVAPRRRLPRPGNWSNPLLLLAAVLLVVGAALGNWFALGLGWLIAWASRRLSPVESKWAVLGMPGLAVTAGVVWLWGRTDGRWGDPIVKGHMNEAVAQTWPWVVRGAAVTSALYLVWRSQRRR
ncbi:hypothetical protein [Streptomyces olivochromogenes]|uniref:Membrane protein n=1 Tax=Streptomyces olivochromogenes TaxID=1963 RepID=A0A250VH14_STROL|nr:hypothetical protein [Streptomyces olivochromogenes]KUN44959.1 hypothetical protein AQJ27_22970 [Streptomyces olivochromogenes]GAX53483.1 membrane protein [Streptomyces olivochromogenes]